MAWARCPRPPSRAPQMSGPPAPASMRWHSRLVPAVICLRVRTGAHASLWSTRDLGGSIGGRVDHQALGARAALTRLTSRRFCGAQSNTPAVPAPGRSSLKFSSSADMIPWTSAHYDAVSQQPCRSRRADKPSQVVRLASEVAIGPRGGAGAVGVLTRDLRSSTAQLRTVVGYAAHLVGVLERRSRRG